MPFWGSLSVWVTLGTLRHCGHYGMHLPLGIPCVTVKGSVREGCLSLWGSCQFSVIMSSLCHHRGSSRHWDVSVSWGLVSLGFCVFEGPCPITEFPRMKGFLCHFWDFIGKPCALWGPCASVGDICDNYVGICITRASVTGASSVLRGCCASAASSHYGVLCHHGGPVFVDA